MISATFCLQFGLRNLDTARKTTLVTQVLQDEAERLRLENWATIAALPAEEVILNPSPLQFADTPFADMVEKGSIIVTRFVGDIDGYTDVKQITLHSAWTDLGGDHERMLHFRYAKAGTNDYYYGTLD